MRVLGVGLLVACTGGASEQSSEQDAGTEDWTPDTGWGEDEVDAPEIEASTYGSPLGLVALDETLIYSDERGVYWNVDEDWWNIAPDVQGAGQLVLARGGLVVADETAGTVGWMNLDSLEITPLASGLAAPIRVAGDAETAWWIDGDDTTGELFAWSGGEPQRVTEGLDEPKGLAVHGGHAYILEAGARRVQRFASSGESEVVGETSLDGRGIGVDDAGVIVTTESSRWPFPGWVEDVEAGTALCEAPPNPGAVLLTSTRVIFASKQTISMVGRTGGAASNLALRTDVGAMVMAGERLVWTDIDTRQVLSLTP